MRDAGLTGFIEEVTGDSHLRVEEDLGGGYVRLRTSEAERRQAQQDIRCVEDVVLELLRNSRDAGARLICIATHESGGIRHIAVIDDGCGIPRDMWERVFEPRVTSKLDSFHADQWGVHGRGMALFSVACNTREHRVAQSGENLGTVLCVSADTKELPQKTDQSSLPKLVLDDTGRKVIRGPRNINRIVTEFTLAQRGSCVVYLGSPNEVLATLVAHGKNALSSVELAFADDGAAYPVCLRPAIASSPEELADIAASYGMPISSRSARRILDGSVEPLQPFASLLELDAGEEHGGRRGPKTASRPPRFSEEDANAFARGVQEAYAQLAEAYYLDENVMPRMRVMRDGIHVTIPFVAKQEDAR